MIKILNQKTGGEITNIDGIKNLIELKQEQDVLNSLNAILNEENINKDKNKLRDKDDILYYTIDD